MRKQESVPVPRGWTGEAAWMGAGASLFLHLFVGAVVVVALSGPPKAAPQVVDLTLLPPAEIHQRPVRPAFAAGDTARDSGTPALPEPPALHASPAVTNPPDGTAPSDPPEPAAKKSAPPPAATPASAAPTPATAATAGRGSFLAAAESPPGRSDAGFPARDFAWIREEIQRAIAYPATARRMGWEGKVVVAFRLLPDGSVRNVRVVQGSGHASLDRGAVDAVRNASPFSRTSAEVEVITPVVYRLTAR